MDLLEYLVRVRGGAAAAAEVRGLAGEMNTLAASQARVGASGAEAAAGTGRMSGALGVAAKGVGALTVVAVATGLEAVKMANSFNHEMLRIRTDAGASTRELASMKKGVLDLAASGASMGQGPMSLAQGLYHLESLGIRGAKALEALKLASQEAAISGANLEQTTSALGAAIYVGIKGTGNLQQTMGILNATVGAGNMRFQDLVDALGTGILASSKVAGLSIQDVGAALAVLSDGGQHAASGAAQLATALHFLYNPADKAKAALKTIGLSSTALALDMHKPQGLLVALRDLHDHLHGLTQVQQAQVLGDILPGGRGRVLLTLIEQLDRLQGKYKQIGATAGAFGGSVAMQRRDPTTELHMASARAQADLIRLGNVLTPIVTPALTAVLNAGSAVLEWLTKLPAAIGKVIGLFSGAGGHISGFAKTVMGAFTSIGHTASQLWGDLSRFFGQIVAAARHAFSGEFVHDLGIVGAKLAQFGAIVFKVVGTISKHILPGLVTAVKGAFGIIRGVVEVLAGLLTLDFGKAWQGVKDIFSGALKEVIGIFQTFTSPVAAAASAIASAISAPFAAVGSAIVSAFKTAIETLIGIANTAIDAINAVNPFGSIGHISDPFGGGGGAGGGTGQFGSGITATIGRVAGNVAQTIAPASPASNAGTQSLGAAHARHAAHASAVQDIHVHTHIGGKEVAHVVRRQIIRAQAASS